MAWAGSGGFTQTWVDILANTTAIDVDTDSLKVALFGSGVTPAYDAAASLIGFNTGTWTTANEVSGTGWASGGVVLTSVTLTAGSPAAGQYRLDAADVSETTTTLSGIEGCFIYSDTIATPVADQGILAQDWSGLTGAPFSTTAGTLTITWHATNGILYDDLVP